MKILAIETTGSAASVAIVDKSGIIAEFWANHKKNHSVTLMPLAAYALEMAELSLSNISHIALGSGPGSFTGLRLSGAYAKSLAHGANIPIVPVPTLDGLAYNILMENRVIAPIMDAKRNEVYACAYFCENGSLKRLTPYLNEGFDVFLDRVKSFGSSAVFLGDGCFVHEKTILERGFNIAAPNNLLQRASSVGLLAYELAALGKTVNYNNLELTYLRKPQAERELEIKENSLK
ncbi:MAG: tRNA (adenosine(37)-N6)-threonylcarbamoyltransferase complex dimerization subunit type 1 TsaB [Defluviitaleaceae bacterium]|nr:tRNA (adenosine(37)-N6)-threonylcarbamoyltransferase complex dimerization subunit type 1 TsaB [Defluviitaleaceae bacterium]